MRKEVYDAVWASRAFYVVLFAGGLTAIMLYDNDLRDSILHFRFWYFGPYFALFAVATYLFWTSGDNPGFLGEIPMRRLEENGANDQELTNMIPEAVPDSAPSEGNTDAPAGRADIEQHGTGKIKPIRPQKWYCQHCKMRHPFRAKYCEKCEKCIVKFDHHCFWLGNSSSANNESYLVGGCVGELNHGKFWILLFLQTVLHLWSTLIVSTSSSSSRMNRLLVGWIGTPPTIRRV